MNKEEKQHFFDINVVGMTLDDVVRLKEEVAQKLIKLNLCKSVYYGSFSRMLKLAGAARIDHPSEGKAIVQYRITFEGLNLEHVEDDDD